MSLPLATVIDNQDYLTSVLKMMHEFLSEFFNQASGFDTQIETVEHLLSIHVFHQYI